MPQYKLVIASFPGGWSNVPQIHPASSRWIAQTIIKAKADPRISDVLASSDSERSDTPITMLRNKAAKDALGIGADYLLMIDSDNEPDSELGIDPSAKPFWESTWEFLQGMRDKPCCVAAPYVGIPPHENIYVFKWTNLESDCPEDWGRIEQFSREEAALRSGIELVPALPTGVCLYDLRVFQHMTPPWFYYEYTDEFQTAKASTEDVTQTRDMVLAYHASGGLSGGLCFCNWDAWAAHHKLKKCRKPRLTTSDTVAENFKQAVLKGIKANEKVMVLRNSDMPGRRPPDIVRRKEVTVDSNERI